EQKPRVPPRCWSQGIPLEREMIGIPFEFSPDSPVPGLHRPWNSRKRRQENDAEFFELRDDRSWFGAAAPVDGIEQRILQYDFRIRTANSAYVQAWHFVP